MIGKRSPQRGMFAVSASTAGEADHLYLDFVGRDSFYGLLATERGNLFRDEDFGRLYCPDNGRNSVPPSLLATALLLQAHDRLSDDEAKARADFDVRWKVSLGIGIDNRPFAKSTLQLFRAQLILHDQVRAVFQRSLLQMGRPLHARPLQWMGAPGESPTAVSHLSPIGSAAIIPLPSARH